MFLDRDSYIELQEWRKLGVSAIYTKKNYGNIKEMESVNLK